MDMAGARSGALHFTPDSLPSSLLERLPDGVVVLDHDWRYAFLGGSAERILGRTMAQLMGRTPWEVFGAEAVADFRAAAERAVREGLTVEYESRHDELDAWFAVRLAPAEMGVVAEYRDVTERKRERDALQRTTRNLKALIEAAPQAIVAVDLEWRVTLWNAAAEKMFGWPAEEVLGEPLPFIPDSAREEFRNQQSLAAHEEGIREVESQRLRRDGSLVDVTLSTALLREADGAPAGVIAVLADISERKAAERALRESETRHRLLFESNPCAMWVYDVSTFQFLAVNDAAIALYGFSRDEFLAMTISGIRPDEEVDGALQHAAELPADTLYTGEWRHRKKSGAAFDVSVTSYGITFGGRAARLVVATDVSDRKRAEAALVHQAYHDTLTNLPNRSRFRERVERALTHPDRPRGRVAVLFVDLDDFKAVNDGLGHEAGDRFLVLAAERLLNATRGCDTVARLGGDEFAILLENMGQDEDALIVAQRVSETLRAPYEFDGRVVRSGASIGIARASGVDTADQLLRNADLAMYRAKAAGKGRYEIFDPAMHAALVERLELETDLRSAVSRGEMKLVYQPIIDLMTGDVVGAEALARWHRPGRGVVSPAEFIPLAEQTDLIVPIGRFVVMEACRAAVPFARANGDGPTITVNVSGRQLDEPGFVHDVSAALGRTGLAPSRLVLELTETVLMRDPERALGRLAALRALGVRLAVDDFGTGYSSLAYLQRFPVDVLKIDKAFVNGVASNPGDRALARTVIALGQALSLRTVAEGVETEEQAAALRALGCRYAQGYLFGVPSDVRTALRGQQSNAA